MNISWVDKGVFGDEKMPDVDNERLLAIGVRVSAEIDVSAAFAVIGKIRSGRISYFVRPMDGTEVIVYCSLDGGVSWNELVNGAYIKDAERLNEYPFVRLKYVIRSYMSQLRNDAVPKLYQVNVELSDKPLAYWLNNTSKKMEWSGGI